jgi:hypothetical protein
MAVSYEVGGDKVSLGVPTGYAGLSRRKQGRIRRFSSSQKVMCWTVRTRRSTEFQSCAHREY